MAYPVIQLSSVTYAMRAQKLLERHGIRSAIRKKSNPTDVKGCGYGVEVHGNVREAEQILRNAGIRVGEIYGG